VHEREAPPQGGHPLRGSPMVRLHRWQAFVNNLKRKNGFTFLGREGFNTKTRVYFVLFPLPRVIEKNKNLGTVFLTRSSQTSKYLTAIPLARKVWVRFLARRSVAKRKNKKRQRRLARKGIRRGAWGIVGISGSVMFNSPEKWKMCLKFKESSLSGPSALSREL
jgi:hypothetical protein